MRSATGNWAAFSSTISYVGIIHLCSSILTRCVKDSMSVFGMVYALVFLRFHTRRPAMPEKKTIKKARKAKREGKSPTTQAGEFVREEIHHVREGKHGARSTKQAIAIGLSKARRAGVKIPRKGTAAKRSRSTGRGKPQNRPSARRSRAISRALKREGRPAPPR